MSSLEVHSFFDLDTHNVSHVAIDRHTKMCAIIDSVLNYDAASGRIKTHSADEIISLVESLNLKVEWIIETHIHADHITGAQYLHSRLGGKKAISEKISEVWDTFAPIFNFQVQTDNDLFGYDYLFKDDEEYKIGSVTAKTIHTPGHTPACMTHLIGDVAFVGDTLFMPDFGTARCDFPGGDARQLYQSIQRLYQLPDSTRVFHNHDYTAPGREEYGWETTIGDQKENNVHIRQSTTEQQFVKVRTERDKSLSVPKLIIPSVQMNICAGSLPQPEGNNVSYIRVPINQF